MLNFIRPFEYAHEQDNSYTSDKLCRYAFCYGQFYNGHQMSFGKSRVQYNNFLWSYVRYEDYDVYFNQNGKELARNTATIAGAEMERIENLFNHTLSSRVIFVVYNKLTDFRQGNQGLVTGKEDNNIGGVTQISSNIVFLYFEGDYEKFTHQIAAVLAQLFINDLLYGTLLRQNITNSTLINLPEWYTAGLVSYVAEDWNFEIEDRVKDGILSGKYEKFNRLTGEDARYAGHSLWHYIAETFGESVISNILYITKVDKNANRGFQYTLGSSVKELSYDWTGYYLSHFKQDTIKLSTGKKLIKRPARFTHYQHVAVSPGGKYAAYVSNKMGRYKVFLLDTETGKRHKILRREHKLDQITDYSYPVLAWHPTGLILTFITEEEGGLKLYFYNLADKSLQQRNLLYYEKILSFAYSPDGSKMVFSAVQNGQSDLFVFTPASGTSEQLTDDYADDLYPRFARGAGSIVFSSNRPTDTIRYDTTRNVQPTRDLFIYNFAQRSPILIRLSDGGYNNESHAIETSRDKYLFLSDKTGIINRYFASFDSTITAIDTAVHYRYNTTTRPLTDYTRNILEHDYSPRSAKGISAQVVSSRYNLFAETIDLEAKTKPSPITPFRRKYSQRMAEQDSLARIRRTVIPIVSIANDQFVINQSDTLTLGAELVDINNYQFEKDKIDLYNEKFEGYNLRLTLDTARQQEPKIRVYQRAYFPNFLVNQIDFSFLNASYQTFTGGAFYFNPGMNLLFKIGANDLLEDYRITGGVRFALDFDANEYLVSFENLKGRIDKTWVFHRQAFKNITTDNFLIKTHSNEVFGVFKFPFSQVSATKLTLSGRYDRTVYLSEQSIIGSLKRPNIDRYWAGIKLEYIFDNVRNLGINLYDGTRLKIFGEAYQEALGRWDDLFVVGADVRQYINIHRNLIWANRLAASTSFGSSALIYYLGSVDNWINFSQQKVPTFIPFSEIPIDNEKNYAYQALATNMRGFPQNIRNGNSFAVFNSELRLPVFRYFANYPISNAFINNFQIVGFMDVGAAWNGLDPFANNNAYNRIEYVEKNVKVIIDTQRSPLVAGYGFGLRSQLLGYFIRLDWAWGIENRTILPRIFYLSLNLDF